MEFAATASGVPRLITPTWMAARPDAEENSIVLATLTNILWISAGAIGGANARYFLSRWMARNVTASVPYGTLLINVSGSLVLGFFMAWTTERVLADPRWRLLIAIGFCGSYTTFSSYAFETMAYAEHGHWWAVAANFVANNVLSLGAVVVGAALARAL